MTGGSVLCLRSDAPTYNLLPYRGAALHCRLAQWNPDRFFASVYLAVGGIPFSTSKTDYNAFLPMLKQMFGAEIFAYQEFFTRAPDAAQVLEKNVRKPFQRGLP